MSETDLELLARYARNHADDAFGEVVRRHVDFVFSAAIRQVRSPQLAEEVAQSTFLKLARHAPDFAPGTIVTAWLYQVTRRKAIDVVRREVRRQLREQIAMEMNAVNATAADWTHIEPFLDEAMHALDETDRAAVLLRYFENKSLREVGEALGMSDDAAQKRVSRAVERLREYLAKRGVTIGASGLVVLISTHAVLMAPVGLSAAITAAAIAGTTISASTAIATATKAITMTTLQKTLIAAAFAATIGTGIYEARQAAGFRAELLTIRQQQEEQNQQAQGERDEAARRLSALADENERLRGASADQVKLRAEVTRLRAAEQELARLRSARPQLTNSPSPPLTEGAVTELTRDSWANVGFATPQEALRTRGWSVLTTNLERFAESVYITEATRKAVQDVLSRMVETSKNPEQAKAVMQQAMEKKFAIEEGLLTRMRGENIGKSYTGYRILSQQTPSAEETILEVETLMESAPPRKELLKFRRFGNDWKVVVDKELKTPAW